MAKNMAVFGIYPSRESIDEGIAELREAGFRNVDISVLLPQNVGSKELAHEKATKAPEGGAAGAASGAVIGGAAGWLAGVGILAIPGLGPFFVAGPIVALLAGAGAGGAVGGVIGALVGLGIPEYEAKRYEGRLRKAGILLSVHCDDSAWARNAETILKETGAEDISTTSERKADFAAAGRPARRREPARHEARETPLGAKSDAPLHHGHLAHFETVTKPHPLAHVRHITVRDVMTKEIDVVDSDASLSEAAEKMLRLDVGFLPVRSGDSIIGLITDRDITIRASAHGLSPTETSVSVAMTSNYVYCFDHQDLVEAAKIMEASEVRRLPVFDREMRFVGVMSLADLAAKAGDEKLAEEVLNLVAAEKR